MDWASKQHEGIETIGIASPSSFITYLFDFPTHHYTHNSVKPLINVRRKRGEDAWTTTRMSYVDALNMCHRKIRQGFVGIGDLIK